jgi:hypothetical protein
MNIYTILCAKRNKLLGWQLLFYVPLLYLLNHLFAFNGFIWAQPAADILTTGIALVLSRLLFRIMRGE